MIWNACHKALGDSKGAYHHGFDQWDIITQDRCSVFGGGINLPDKEEIKANEGIALYTRCARPT